MDTGFKVDPSFCQPLPVGSGIAYIGWSAWRHVGLIIRPFHMLPERVARWRERFHCSHEEMVSGFVNQCLGNIPVYMYMMLASFSASAKVSSDKTEDPTPSRRWDRERFWLLAMLFFPSQKIGWSCRILTKRGKLHDFFSHLAPVVHHAVLNTVGFSKLVPVLNHISWCWLWSRQHDHDIRILAGNDNSDISVVKSIFAV